VLVVCSRGDHGPMVPVYGPYSMGGANLRNAKSRATANASNRGGGAPRLIPGESRFYLRGSLRMKGDRATRHSERLRADGNGPRPTGWELRPRCLAPQPAAGPPGPIRPRQLRPPLCRGSPEASLPKQPSPPPAMRAPFPESR
jgi:hypothetical protein